MENKEQVYSVDKSNYMSWENIMDELREGFNEGESVEVWEADKVVWKHSDFIDVETIRDDMQVFAMDECGEMAEEYLNDLTDQQKLNLRDTISAWLSVNAKLNFYGVENEHKIVVIVE